MKWEDSSKQFIKFFQLSSSPVAVKISESELKGQRPKSPSLFCDFVRKAAHDGESFLITEKDLQNFAARVILGFMDPKYVEISPRIKPAKTKSILVAPLGKIEAEPDVVLAIADPARMMHVAQVLHRATKVRLEAKMTCEASAIAGEATALPFMEKESNLTLLCGGARGLAGYKDNELVVGIPFDHFIKMTELLVEPKLVAALCGCVMDEIPKHLKEAFIGLGFDKGTDHFYGEFGRKVFRIYLQKDEKKVLNSATVNYPMKFKSEKEAKEKVKAAEELLAELGGESMAVARENWLDLISIVKFPDGLDKIATDKKRFEQTVNSILESFVAIIEKLA